MCQRITLIGADGYRGMVIVALVHKELSVANKTRTLAVNVVVFVAAALFFMAFIVAMFLPMCPIIGTTVD